MIRQFTACERDVNVVEPKGLGILIWAWHRPERWIETFRSACKIGRAADVTVALPENNQDINLEPFHSVGIRAKGLPEAVEKIFLSGFQQILVIWSPIVMPLNGLDRAVAWMNADPRIGTVSFLSNSAGYLSFPHHNTEVSGCIEGHNEQTLTAALRKTGPDQGAVPIPVCEGGAIVIGRSAFSVAGGLMHIGDDNPHLILAEFALRASRRGFISVLDAGTYVARPWDVIGYERSVLSRPEARHELFRHHHFFPGLHDAQRDRAGLLSQALDLARGKAQGLRVLIDASALGRQEMGTQTLIVCLATALARNDNVNWIGLGVPDPNNVPAYARVLQETSKISILRIGNSLDWPDAPFVDIIHRPFQPTGPIPWDRWNAIAKRSIITIQDLVAYRNGAYFGSWEEWSAYRENLKT